MTIELGVGAIIVVFLEEVVVVLPQSKPVKPNAHTQPQFFCATDPVLRPPFKHFKVHSTVTLVLRVVAIIVVFTDVEAVFMVVVVVVQILPRE